MTPEELRSFAEEVKAEGTWGTYAPIGRGFELVLLAPDLALLVAEMGEALEQIASELKIGEGESTATFTRKEIARRALAKLEALETR